MRHITLSFLILLVSVPASSVTAQISFRGGVSSAYLSNVYLDYSQDPDLSVTPEGWLRFYPGDSWSLGYHGQLDWYQDASDLNAHGHRAQLGFNPYWYSEEGLLRELLLQVEVQSLFNSAALQALDHLTPRISLASTLDFSDLVSLESSLDFNYRHFLNDVDQSQLNASLCAQLGLHLQSRTTILATPCYSHRHYLVTPMRPDTSPDLNQARSRQLEFRLRLAQNLLEGVGLRFEYQSQWILERAERLTELTDLRQLGADLSADFHYHLHRPSLRFSWLASETILGILETAYERRDYEGVAALAIMADELVATSDEREDDRFILAASLEHRRPMISAGEPLVIRLGYRLVVAESNSVLYDFQSHDIVLSFSFGWSNSD